MSWDWRKLGSIVATAVVCDAGAYRILADPAAPRWTVAMAGPMVISGAAATLVLGIIAWSIIVDDIKPALRFHQPTIPLALAHRESALIGQRRFRNHPVRFWGGLTLSNRFFVGFMLLDPPEYETFKVEEPAA